MPHKILAQHADQIALKLLRSSIGKLFVDSILGGWYIRPAEACWICR
jgi:hypothetical protein